MENKKLQELEKKGISALFEDKNFINQAKEIKRLYGNNAFISCIKGKAKEFGFDEVEIKEVDIENIIRIIERN